MRIASDRELNTLRNFLAEHTTGIMRKELRGETFSAFRVKSIIDNGWLDTARITRITNIICKTDALERIAKTCLWY